MRWQLGNERGSVRDIADSSETILNHIVYDSFGNVVSQSSSVRFRYGYTRREYGESGLWYFRRR